MSRKSRYHHLKFDDDDEFQTPAFQFLNSNDNDRATESGDSDDILLEDSEKEDSDEFGNSDEDNKNDDDDAAPEDVSFQTGKQTALQQMKAAIKNISEEKNKVKERRRKMDEQFKEQKKRKMDEFKRARLPDDFLEGLSDRQMYKAKKVKEIETKETKSDSTERSSLLDEDEGSFADTEDDFDHDQDFIPLECDKFSGVQVEPLKEYQKKTSSQALTAAEFKYRQLYGSKIPRESTRAKMAKIEKKKARR